MQLFKIFLPTCSAFYLLLGNLKLCNSPKPLFLSNSVFAVKINLIISFVCQTRGYMCCILTSYEHRAPTTKIVPIYRLWNNPHSVITCKWGFHRSRSELGWVPRFPRPETGRPVIFWLETSPHCSKHTPGPGGIMFIISAFFLSWLVIMSRWLVTETRSLVMTGAWQYQVLTMRARDTRRWAAMTSELHGRC